MTLEDQQNNLASEQHEQTRGAKLPEEPSASAQNEGAELTDDQLEAISGGFSAHGDAPRLLDL